MNPGDALPSSPLRPPRARWAEPPTPDAEAVAALTAGLSLPEVLCRVLAGRGRVEIDSAKRFLRPLLEHLHDPAELADGPLAAERIAEAVRSGETILVHGDYDVDGICATALLTRCLRGWGGRVVPFVPHRLRDGYDFGNAGLAAAQAAEATLIVTADCGTVAVEPVQRARDLGIDVIVTDHHTPGDLVAPANALVNPQRADCAYPESALCGAGVAFKVASLVASVLGEDPAALLHMLDLVALATVADLVPLQGENRVLVRLGLRRFPHTQVMGIAALLAATGIDAEAVTAGQLGFVVAPRINAAGRIGESADALALLLTEDREEARAGASRLEDVNRARQEEDRRTLDEALTLLGEQYDPDRDKGVVLAGEGWHPGVIGIVASRVVERVHRPTVLVALDGDQGRGSARSIPGFHLYDALAACRVHLGRFGGHRQAAGMDVLRESLPAFREAFNAEAERRLEGVDLRPMLKPDAELRLAEADLQLVHWLSYLGPHGIGNPGPLFLVRRVELEKARALKDTHLKVTLRDGSAALDAIGFGLVASHPIESLGTGRFDVLVRLERNEWRGRVSPQARLVDLRPSGSVVV